MPIVVLLFWCVATVFSNPSIGDHKYSFATADHDNWLLLDGRELPRSKYPELLDVIGVSCGEGDHIHTFNICDLRGRTVVSGGQGVGLTNRKLSEVGGTEAHMLTVSEMPAHSHSIAVLGNAGNRAPGGNGWAYSLQDTSMTGGNAPHNNMQPYLVLNSFIYAGVPRSNPSV